MSIYPEWGKWAPAGVGFAKTCVDSYPDKIFKIQKNRSIEKYFLYNVCTENFLYRQK